ncbi:MAG: efflux RND transporter permease subunit [Lachnospiraceae bacterium]|nr:efflux RND transporter permease subunit [Lachnospiraceae bacterium]
MPKFSVKKPFTVLVGVIIAIVLGVVSLINMQLDLLPEISLPYLVVITTYPGASAEKIEAEICEPMEDSLGTINGVKNLYSVCNENYGMVELEFVDGTDLDSAMVKVSSALNSLQPYLPEDAGTPSVIELSTDMMASVYLAVSRDDMDMDELSQFIKDDITPQYKKQNGVASVTTLGLVEKTVEVRLNKAKVDALNDRILASLDGAFADAVEQLDDAKKQLNDSQKTINKNRDKLVKSQKDLEDSVTDLVDGQKELDENKTDYYKNLSDYEENKDKLEENKKKMENAQSELKSKKAEANTKLTEASAKLEQTSTKIDTARDSIDAIDLADKLEQQLTELTNKQTDLQNQLATLTPADPDYASLNTEKNDVDNAIANLTPEKNSAVAAADRIVAGLGAADRAAAKSALQANIAEYEAGYRELEKGKLEAAEELGSADAQLRIGKQQLESADDQLDSAEKQLDSAKKQLDKAQDQITDGWDQIADGKEQIDDGWESIRDGEKQLSDGWDDYNDAVKSYEKQRREAEKKANADQLLTLDALTGLIYAQNFEMPAGYVDDKLDNQWLVKVGEHYGTVTELTDIVLTNIHDVGDITLGDVADITVIDNSDDSYVRLGADKAVVLSIFKSSTVGTNDISKTIKATNEELMERFPGLHVVTLVDMGDYIDLIVKSVLKSMIIGAILAIIILAFFLKDVRPTLVVAISIPLSVMTALVCMYFSDISLNMLSLSGLALGIGMLVDNSIVVIENIYRLRGKGIAAPRAAVQGTKQVFGAITASTLTTACVFLPMIFTTGLVKDLMGPMCLTIVYCLIASLFIAMTVVPAACSTVLKNAEAKKHPMFDKIMDAYGAALRFGLKVKIVPIGAAIGLLALSVFMVIKMGIVVIPDMTMTQIEATITYPDDTLKEDAYRMTDEVIDKLLEVDGLGTIGVMTGGDEALMISELSDQPDNFRTMSFLMMTEDPNAGDAEIRRIMKDIEAAVDGMDVDFKLETMSSEMDDLTGGSGLSINVYGDDLKVLDDISHDLMDIIDGVEGFTDISNGEENADKVLHVDIDKNAAMSKGLSVVQIYQEISNKIKSEKKAVTVTVNGIDMDIRVVNEMEPLTRENLLDYEFTTEITDDDYDTVTEEHKLSEFATVEVLDGVTAIDRKNQSRYITVTAQVEEGYNLTLLSRDLKPLVDSYDLPGGYTIEMGGEYDSVVQMIKQMALVAGLGLLMVYLIMVAQFQSLLSPFIVIFTVPLAFTGGFLSLFVARENMSVISIMGLVVLMGTVVNNGIVFVDYTNQLRKGGLDRHTALVEAGKTRMRPILMTALTTILAESNLIFGDDMATQLGRGMALVIAGGLAYATLMTLFVVPVMYDIMFKKQPVDIDTGSDTELDDIPDDAADIMAQLTAAGVTQEPEGLSSGPSDTDAQNA